MIRTAINFVFFVDLQVGYVDLQFETRLETGLCMNEDRDPRLSAVNLTAAGVYALEERGLKASERYKVRRPLALLLH